MNPEDIPLMNFRIHYNIKNQFQEACRSLQTNMTAELNRMIRDFVQNNHKQKFNDEPIRWFSNNDWT